MNKLYHKITKTIKQISYSSCTEMELDKLIDDIEQEMQNGNLISMYLSSVNGPIRLIKADGSLQQTLMTFNNKVSAHAVFVTGISDIGIIVSVVIILIAVCLIVIKYRRSKKD